MAFEERFALLVESGQVSAEAIGAVNDLLAGVVAYLGRPLDEEADAPAVTHLAMVMERLARGEEVPPLPEEVIDEARGCPEEWALAADLLQRAAAVWGRQAPVTEIAYLTIHLRSLKGEPA